jgi:hypothetical protein
VLFRVALLLLPLSLFGVNFDAGCKYKKEAIHYEDASAFSDGGVSIAVSIPTGSDTNYCMEKKFSGQFSTEISLTNVEKSLISLIIGEYIDYGVQIVGSKEEIAGGLRLYELNRLREKQFKYGRRLIKTLGFNIDEIEHFSGKILSTVDQIEVESVADFLKFYKYEKQKIAIILEYHKLFKDYGMETYITEKLFETMVSVRKGYVKTLKRLFLLAIANSM